MAKHTPLTLRNRVLYSVYIRSYGEGNFAAVECDLDRIRALGTDIVWFLPIHPIGTDKRKGTLGSPYAIADYRAINPEFGTLDDFKRLVDGIHQRGMKCIIDVVYNHTSPDSLLAKTHPEYFYRTPEGKMGNRVGDWSDIVDLDYSVPKLWDYQIETLKQWAAIVDGFRCDVAPLVPLDFWLRARREVGEVRPDCIWLCESVEPTFTLWMRGQGINSLSDGELYQAFDMAYDYDIYHHFRNYLRHEGSLQAYADAINQQEHIYPANYIKLRGLENHDQERAAAIIDEHLIDWTAFSYFQKGITMLYAGQEYQAAHRPSLFEYEPIIKDEAKDLSPLLTRLGEIKKLPIFTDSSYHVQAPNNDTLVATHAAVAGDDMLLGVFRVGESSQISLPLNGTFENLINGERITIENGSFDTALCPAIFQTQKVTD